MFPCSFWILLGDRFDSGCPAITIEATATRGATGAQLCHGEARASNCWERLALYNGTRQNIQSLYIITLKVLCISLAFSKDIPVWSGLHVGKSWYANWQMHWKSGLRNAGMEKQPGHHWNAEATLLLFGRSLLHNSSESNPWNRQDAAASQPRATEGGTTRWHPHRNQSRSSPNLCQPDCTGIHIGPKHIPQDVQKEQFSISGRTTCAYRCASIQAVRSCIRADINVWSVQLVEICVHTNAQHENLCSAHASLLQQNSSSNFI